MIAEELISINEINTKGWWVNNRTGKAILSGGEHYEYAATHGSELGLSKKDTLELMMGDARFSDAEAEEMFGGNFMHALNKLRSSWSRVRLVVSSLSIESIDTNIRILKTLQSFAFDIASRTFKNVDWGTYNKLPSYSVSFNDFLNARSLRDL